jgi:DnaJ-class molecular chaperone
MPEHAQNTPVCRYCDGFPVVAITTGSRHNDGSRILLRVECRTCQGTGRTLPAALAPAGR